MLIIPALDLSEGKVVGLRGGSCAEVYSDAPENTAAEFERQGARWLHVVDLDGAKTGTPQNVKVLRRIVRAVKIPLQFAGGVRELHTAELMLGLGVSRVVLRSVLAGSLAAAEIFFRKLGDRCAAGIISGRRPGREGAAGTDPFEIAAALRDMGCPRVIYTDAGRTGGLLGPDVDGIRTMAEHAGVPVIAAGGIASREDLRNLQALEAVGLEGVIIGRALHEKRIDLAAWTE